MRHLAWHNPVLLSPWHPHSWNGYPWVEKEALWSRRGSQKLDGRVVGKVQIVSVYFVERQNVDNGMYSGLEIHWQVTCINSREKCVSRCLSGFEEFESTQIPDEAKNDSQPGLRCCKVWVLEELDDRVSISGQNLANSKWVPVSDLHKPIPNEQVDNYTIRRVEQSVELEVGSIDSGNDGVEFKTRVETAVVNKPGYCGGERKEIRIGAYNLVKRFSGWPVFIPKMALDVALCVRIVNPKLVYPTQTLCFSPMDPPLKNDQGWLFNVRKLDCSIFFEGRGIIVGERLHASGLGAWI
ncbi:hypothetical protein P691DRAFT_788038 [Macrolepiota fuliginosa MF-IS2]|uniref:Uncharacterized protein n=1 Tax=Macrolepiota fuliginosa MF-IS2 TaxID=1400762 RepID=A0A9P5X4E8_9AGAR|nr:hypothetical protein P691DRAFT_788038 [Macrolepiota fuliginosa MF-IS2]